MATRLQDKKSDLLERVVDRLHDKLTDGPAERAEAFIRHYYRAVAPVDLLERDPLDVYGAALSHLRLGEHRQAGQSLVRVYNPQIEQHGWQSTHTVVEVVTDDMPFLVDSVSMALNRLGLLIHITIHPVMPVKRDFEAAIQTVLDAAATDGGDALLESYMHFEVDRQSDPERIEAIRTDIESVLADVRVAVEDWRPIIGKVEVAIEELQRGARVLEATELAEAEAFVRWIADNHFTFLGYGCYDLIRDKAGDQLKRVEASALGLLRRQRTGSRTSRSFASLPPALRLQARAARPLVITKASTRSTVHRPVYLDYVGVRRFDAKGKVLGEHRFLGLFTSAAYNRNPRSIPLLRHKVARMVARADLAPTGHSGKALANILDTYPRDELFQTSDDELFETVQEILHLHERQSLRLFLRRDAFARFVSCMIYVPRERYNTEIRRKFQDILLEALNGTEVEFQAQVSESILARIQFIVRTPDGIPVGIDRGEIEARLIEASRSWSDVLSEALTDAHGEEEGNRLARAYGEAIPVGYQEQVPARAAVPDIDRIDRLAKGEIELAMSLYRPLEQGTGELRLKLVRAGQAIALSDVLPVLENMGLRVIQEQPYDFTTAAGATFWLHNFSVEPIGVGELDPDQAGPDFQDAFLRVWRGEAENDGFNQLILQAGLNWRQVVVLRTYCKYLLQIGIPFSQAYMEQTLVQQSRAGAAPGRAVRGALRPGRGRRPSGAPRQPGGRVPQRPRRRRQPRRGSDPAALHAPDPGDPAHQLLSARTRGRAVQALPVVQDRSRPGAGHAAAAPGLRDLRLCAAHRGRPSARRQGRPRRHPLVGPARGFPDRGFGPDEGADGQERGHRPGRRQGRLRGQAPAQGRRSRGAPGRGDRLLPDPDARHARPDRQPGRRPGGRAAAGGPLRRRRPLSGGRGRQGHRDLLGHRQRDQPRVRPLAGRRVRVRRLGGLRPQGHGDHRARRLGVGQAAFPRARPRLPGGAVHGDRDRRHVGRRVRQRHAAVGADPADRGLRSSPRVHRSGSRSGDQLRRAQAAVRAAALELGRLRPQPLEPGRRRLAADRQVDQAVARGPARARRRGRGVHAAGADPGDPARAGRPVLERRHRHLRQGRRRAPRRGVRSRQRRRPGRRRAAALQGDRRGRQSRPDPARRASPSPRRAAGSTPTSSTTRPASTAPITRSTSRSCSARWSARAT